MLKREKNSEKRGTVPQQKKTRGLSPKMCFFVVVVFIVCKKGGKKNFFFLHVNLFPFFVFHDVSDFVNERRVRYRK